MTKNKQERKIKHKQLFGFLQGKIKNFDSLDSETKKSEIQNLQRKLPFNKKLNDITYDKLIKGDIVYKLKPKFGFIKTPVLAVWHRNYEKPTKSGKGRFELRTIIKLPEEEKK